MSTRLTPEVVAKLLKRINYFLFDIDGVLWNAKGVFPKARETIKFLKGEGKEVRFITNKSSVARSELLHMFASRKFSAVRLKDIYTCGRATALYLKDLAELGGQKKFSRNILVVGTKGLHSELQMVLSRKNFTYGLELNNSASTAGSYDALWYNEKNAAKWISCGLPAPSSRHSTKLCSLQELGIGAIVVGHDPKASLSKLAVASMCILEAKKRGHDVPFVVTNRDPQTLIGDCLVPSTGPLASYIETASGKRADATCGKPNTLMFEMLAKAEGIEDRSSVLMVGDRLTTDIAFGIACGVKTLHVESGCEKGDDEYGITPDYRAAGVGDLLIP